MTVKIAEGVVKNINKNTVVKQMKSMLDHFETYNFITKPEKKCIEFDFNGENLRQIIKKEWLLTNYILCDQPSFCFRSFNKESGFKNAFGSVKNMVGALPFSLIETDKNFQQQENNKEPYESENEIDLIKNQFKCPKVSLLTNYTFCSPQNGMEYFYSHQRERKIWWRKLSAVPGRFHTTEICNDEEKKIQFVEINAEFPWGVETVEVVKYLPEILLSDPDYFEIKNQRKKLLPQVVISETSLEKAAFTYLCDAFEMLNQDTNREILRFSRKLAPYKVAFAATGSLADTIQNLKDLSMLLARKIRKCGISVLLLPDMCTLSVERQILRNDALGIPYTVLLNETTLKDGIISIRSRDTTLKEQSHVSLVVSYIEKLMKSY